MFFVQSETSHEDCGASLTGAPDEKVQISEVRKADQAIMPPPSRSRYNAKARGHPHKKRKISKESKKIKHEASSHGLEEAGPDSLGVIDVPMNTREAKKTHESDENIGTATSTIHVEPELVDALHIPKTAAQKEQEKKDRMMQEVRLPVWRLCNIYLTYSYTREDYGGFKLKVEPETEEEARGLYRKHLCWFSSN